METVKFEELQLDDHILRAVTDMGFEEASPIQAKAIPVELEGCDIIGQAQTGTGKTAAFGIPLLQKIDPKKKKLQAIALCPTRELAIQVADEIRNLAKYMHGIKILPIYGGQDIVRQIRGLKDGTQIIIGTPGRMNDHLSKQNFDADTVTTLVIDEFDKCLEFGFQEEMATVIGQLPNLQRRFLLSATDAEEIPQFTGLDKTIKLNFLNPEEQLTHRLHLYKVLSPEKDKLETLYKLLCTLGSQSTLVFCNHRESVERVGKYLQSQKFQCGIFHGGMEQDDRERSLYKFRNGSCHVLISTDLAARGLDIPEIENVVHYHLPANEDGYIHRNGRTARWEAEGNSYVILHAEETVPAYITDEPEEFILPEVTPKPSLPEYVTLYIGKGKKDKINKIDIVGFLFKKGNLNKDEIGRIDVKDHYSFAAVSRKKIKQTLNLIRNEKIKGIKTLIEEAK